MWYIVSHRHDLTLTVWTLQNKSPFLRSSIFLSSDLDILLDIFLQIHLLTFLFCYFSLFWFPGPDEPSIAHIRKILTIFFEGYFNFDPCPPCYSCQFILKTIPSIISSDILPLFPVRTHSQSAGSSPTYSILSWVRTCLTLISVRFVNLTKWLGPPYELIVCGTQNIFTTFISEWQIISGIKYNSTDFVFPFLEIVLTIMIVLLGFKR